MAEHQIIARIHTGFPEKFGIPQTKRTCRYEREDPV